MGGMGGGGSRRGGTGGNGARGDCGYCGWVGEEERKGVACSGMGAALGCRPVTRVPSALKRPLL